LGISICGSEEESIITREMRSVQSAASGGVREGNEEWRGVFAPALPVGETWEGNCDRKHVIKMTQTEADNKL